MYLLVIVSTDGGEGESSWVDAEQLPGWEQVRVVAEPTSAEVARALTALRSQRIFSMALLRELPVESDTWVLIEWNNALVTEVPVGQVPGVAEFEWQLVASHGSYLVWRTGQGRDPRVGDDLEVVPSRREFGRRIASPDPVGVVVHRDELELSNADLFGPYAQDRLGGSCALVALSDPGDAGRQLVLRNPAALKLDDVSDESSMAAHLHAIRVIDVSAVGLSRYSGAVEAAVFAHFRDPGTAGETWTATDRSAASFWIVAEFTAAVDPELIVPTGSVFEQRSLNGVQTLAASSPWTLDVGPTTPRTVAMRAWCLNEPFKPPSGQPLALTPFRARHRHGSTQKEVWSARGRIVEAARP